MGSMSDTVCRVCGAADHRCLGTGRASRTIVDVTGVRKVVGPLRAPRQRDTIGRAGYVGAVETYEPRAPRVRLVDHPADEPEIGVDLPDPGDPSDAADGVSAGDPPEYTADGDEAATAQGDEAMAGKSAAPAKENKAKPADKARKGAESK